MVLIYFYTHYSQQQLGRKQLLQVGDKQPSLLRGHLRKGIKGANLFYQAQRDIQNKIFRSEELCASSKPESSFKIILK